MELLTETTANVKHIDSKPQVFMESKVNCTSFCGCRKSFATTSHNWENVL